MTTFFAVLRSALIAIFKSRQALILDSLALRQQLAAYKRTRKRARLRPSDRIFWVWLSNLRDQWRSALGVVHHFVFFSEDHIRRVCREYIDYYTVIVRGEHRMDAISAE